MIRSATHADATALTDLVGEFFANGELDGTGLMVDPLTLEFFIQDCIDQDHCCILVAEHDGEVTGCIAGVITPWMFNADIRILAEIGWFIPKRHRAQHPTDAISLLKAFRKWGRANGASVLNIVSTVREESPRVIQMYHNIGLRHIDNNFIGRL